jgi:hypothetical protein
MTITDDLSTEISPDALERTYDRRRPGPRSGIHADLLPLYRGIVQEPEDEDDGLRPAQEVLFGLILGAACWVVIGAAVWWLVD